MAGTLPAISIIVAANTALLCACGHSGDGDASATTGVTTGTSTETTTSNGATTTHPPDACMSSEDCETAGVCAADYDPGTGGMGAPVCVPTCIQANDLMRWCIDDDACCETLRCRKVDGFCELPSFPGTGTDGGTTTGETTTGTSTATTGESDSTTIGSTGSSGTTDTGTTT